MVDLTFLAAVPFDGFEPERAGRLRGEAACCCATSEPIGLSFPGLLLLCRLTAQASGPETHIGPPLPCLTQNSFALHEMQ